MSRASSVIDESCLLDATNDSSSCALPFAVPQPLDARSRNPNSKITQASLETVQRTTNGKASGSPADSCGSKLSGDRHTGIENIAPSRTSSHSALQATFQEEPPDIEQAPQEALNDAVYKTGQWPYVADGDYVEDSDLIIDANDTKHLSATQSVHLSVTGLNNEAFKCTPGIHFFDKEQKPADSSEEEALAETRSFGDCPPSRKNSSPFVVTGTAPQAIKRIFSSIRAGPQHLNPSEERQDLGDEFEPSLERVKSLEVPPQSEAWGHRKTSSGFSSGFFGGAKSASAGPSSSNASKGSQKTHWSRSRFSRFSKRSSRLSVTTNRSSVDSDHGPGPATYEATTGRALRRRKIIGELISSETGYIYDLRILTHVYLALLCSTQNFDKNRLNKIENNIIAMIALHEEILVGLKSIAQQTIVLTEGKRTLPRLAKHIRYESLDSLRPMSRGRKSFKERGMNDQEKRFGARAEPKEAAEVASLFGEMLGGTSNTQMGKFSVYEEYGAKYAEILQACASASRNIPNWDVFERGIEALVNQVLPQGVISQGDKKALAFEDLLIKVLDLVPIVVMNADHIEILQPIQRICRYPLLFADLECHCPAIDDPESHTIITKVLDRLRETAHEINNVTNDLEARARLRRSQHLEDLLGFPDTYRPSFSVIRDLGHAKLCGVLFVAYQSRDGGIRGEFMLCALFNSFMLLASPEPGYEHFKIGAIIRLHKLRIDTSGNGKGLQCHSTPHTWKMIFESDSQLYEALFCACTESEEERWRSELRDFSTRENQRQTEMTDSSLVPKPDFLFLEVEEFAEKSGSLGNSSRGCSIQPVSRIKPSTRTVPVIIKNTHIPLRGDYTEPQNNASTSLNRSHLRVTTNATQILVPDRSDRIRMEQAMSDVWTRDTLPFPAMTTNRSGQFFRASTSMMRRLSKASVTSTSSRRSVSQRSRASTIDIGLDGALDDPFVDKPTAKGSEVFESADVATALPTLHLPPDNKDPRRVSFSDDVKKPVGKEGDDAVSDTSTVIGKTGKNHTIDNSKKPKALSKALSKDRIIGWFS